MKNKLAFVLKAVAFLYAAVFLGVALAPLSEAGESYENINSTEEGTRCVGRSPCG